MKLNFENKFNSELKQFPFVIVDVGARSGPQEKWLPLMDRLKFIGFEPNHPEYERLKAKFAQKENVVYINSACYDKKAKLTLHITADEGLSSIFMPNYDFLSHFSSSNTEGYKLKNKIFINADRLDNMISNLLQQELDFIKVDVEGCAFEVMKGADETIKNNIVVGLEVEAEFNEKYKGQSLFSEVDLLLRKYGYQLFDAKLCYWKRNSGIKTGGRKGQLLHGNFIYFIDIQYFFEKIKSVEQMAKVAKIIKFIIFCCIYEQYDLAMELLSESANRGLLDNVYYEIINKELAKAKGIFMRLPKLKDRGLFFDLIYHFYMLGCGLWLKRLGFYKPKVVL